MADVKDGTPPFVYLHYDEDDLIMKEGNYGVSIYKILKGHVIIFKSSGGKEIPLAMLGPGEIFGEMSFLNKFLEPRAASAKALEDVEVEAWHPIRLTKEYNEIPPVIRYIINQTMYRLNWMNKIVSELSQKKEGSGIKASRSQAGEFEKKVYRKEFTGPCVYRPAGDTSRVKLRGHVTDMSRWGLNMNASARNTIHFAHNPEDEFEVNVTLPTGQDVDVVGKVKSIGPGKGLGQMRLELEFTKLTQEASRILGFFLIGE